MVRNQGCCPTSYTTQSSPIIKNHLAPNVNSARVDKLEVRERIPHWREWNEHTYAQYWDTNTVTSASFPHSAPTVLLSVILPHRAVGVLSEKSYQFQKKMSEETDIKRFQQASCLRTEPIVKSFLASLSTPLLHISSEGLPNIWKKWHIIQKGEIWSYARERKSQGNCHPWKRTENITCMKQGQILWKRNPQNTSNGC